MTASSALAVVPAAWRPFEDHRHGARRAGSLPVREDLRLIRFAERLGYAVGFRDGNCHHGATFTLGATTVWWACRTGSSMAVWWQAKTVFVEEDGVERYEREARVYGSGLAGLKAALKAEWRRAGSPGAHGLTTRRA